MTSIPNVSFIDLDIMLLTQLSELVLKGHLAMMVRLSADVIVDDIAQ